MKRARVGMIATAVLAVATMAFAQASRTSRAPGRLTRRRRRPAPAAAAGGGAPAAAVAVAAVGAWRAR